MPSRIPPVGTRISVTRERRGTSIRVRLRWTVSGEQTGISKSFPRSPDREEQIGAFIESVRMSKRERTVPGLTIAEFVEKIGHESWLEHTAPSTRRTYLSAWERQVRPFLGESVISALSPRRVRAFGRSIDADSTRRNALAALSRICKSAIDLGYLHENPVAAAQVRRRTAPTREREVLQDDARLMAALPPEWRGFFTVTLECALRSGETCGLQARDYDAAGRTLRIARQVDVSAQVRPPKGGRARSVPVSRKAAEILDQLTEGLDPDAFIFTGPRGGLLTAGSVAQRSNWRQAVAAAGQPDLHVHDLRHTGLTRLLRRLHERGMDIETLRVIAGHQSVTVTQGYLHTDDDTIRAAARLLWD